MLMMIATVRCGALVALLTLATACSGVAPPTAPTATADWSGFAAVSRTARIYVAAASPSSSLLDGSSRYVLYENGAFRLQYSYSRNEYGGSYEDTNGLITFHWQGWSKAGPWGAAGSLRDNSLTVRYNVSMHLNDFEDGVYIRAQ